MPFEIVRNDIALMAADAIVNTANPQPIVGPGVDSRLHRAAGPALLKAREAIGVITPGSAAITPGFHLKAQYVIHTVGPVWQGGTGCEEALLRSCYDNALRLAAEMGCRSVAFPLISSGNYGFPKEIALQIAVSAINAFLLEKELLIYLVVYDRDAFRLSEKRFHSIRSYIDEHYVAAQAAFRDPFGDNRRGRKSEDCERSMVSKALPYASLSLEEVLKQEDTGFSQRLLALIDATGKKDSEIYKKANISKQHFSKIRNNPHYQPTKPTALALAIALELDLEETKDLIGRAGYALTNSSKFDLIIRYFIESGNYRIMDINMALFEFDQALLGM